MNSRLLIPFLGILLIAVAFVDRGWAFLVLWPGLNFLALGIAHIAGWHGIFGKRRDGTIPLWSWVVFLPLLFYTQAIWQLLRIFTREPATNVVNDRLVIGRRLRASEMPDGVDHYLDLTAEFPEPRLVRQTKGYRCMPILDASAPSAEMLLKAINELPPGRIFVHCAQGRGRTGLFALALLLKWGLAKDVEEGLRMLKSVRPGVRLNGVQRECIRRFAEMVRQKGAAVDS